MTYKIKTKHGYKNFKTVKQIGKFEIFKVVLDNGYSLECNFSHKFVVDGVDILLYDIIPGLTYLDTDKGKSLVISIQSTGEFDYVYDVIDVDNADKSYYTNNISSHNCEFQGSSITLIDAKYIVNNLKKEDPVIRPDDYTEMWEQVTPGHKYIVSIDTAGGVGSDYSIMNVFDITHYPRKPALQVAKWRCNIKTPPTFAELVLDSAKYWNNAYVIGEINGLSNEVLNRLIVDNEYENVYYDYDDDTYGIYSDRTSKKKACVIFKEELESGRIVIRDDDTINELGYFEEVSPGVYKAKVGRNFHDDCVVTCIWLAWFLKSRFFEDERDTWGKPNINSGESSEIFSTPDDGDTESLEAFLEFDKESDDNWLDKSER